MATNAHKVPCVHIYPCARKTEQKTQHGSDAGRKVLPGAWMLGRPEDPSQGPMLHAWFTHDLPRCLMHEGNRGSLADLTRTSGADETVQDASEGRF
jgi:hypothetical protein